jgi:hypothetical protein
MKIGTVVKHNKHGFVGKVVGFENGFLGEQPIIEITEGVHPYTLGKDTYIASEPNLEVLSQPFEVGDIITGTPESDDRYGWTTTEMIKGEVVKVQGNDTIVVKIIEHKETHPIGMEYPVNAKFFVRVKPETDEAFESVIKDTFAGMFGTNTGTDEKIGININGSVQVKMEDGTELTFEYYADFVDFVKQNSDLVKGGK